VGPEGFEPLDFTTGCALLSTRAGLFSTHRLSGVAHTPEVNWLKLSKNISALWLLQQVQSALIAVGML